MENTNSQQHKADDRVNKPVTMDPLSGRGQSCLIESLRRESEEEIEAGEPHETMNLVLAYLPVFERLAMAAVSKSLKYAVSEDVLPWASIVFTEPLSSRVTDEILLRIAAKANGRMRTLALINCLNVTDLGLARVVETNPLISELHLPGCIGLTPDGIIRAVKTLTTKTMLLRSLQINGVYSLNKQHLETLSQCLQISNRKPMFYHHQYRTSFLSSAFSSSKYDEKRDGSLDVDACPKCGEVRVVFDCTREICKKKHRDLTSCRGCRFCITRCEECGGCVNGNSELPEPTACLDAVCSDCWLNLPKCNLCNKPYCGRHAARKVKNYLHGFVCERCDSTESIFSDNEI